MTIRALMYTQDDLDEAVAAERKRLHKLAKLRAEYETNATGHKAVSRSAATAWHMTRGGAMRDLIYTVFESDHVA